MFFLDDLKVVIFHFHSPCKWRISNIILEVLVMLLNKATKANIHCCGQQWKKITFVFQTLSQMYRLCCVSFLKNKWFIIISHQNPRYLKKYSW